MTSKIKILKEKTINQIAAGEVVENPASVVKELVENSLDALATEIIVEVYGGGFQSIKVSDDGTGMSGDDVLLSIERHATSKIEFVEDLDELSTMGFRGEALASIASISKMTIVTASRGSTKKDVGIKLECEGGHLKSLDPHARKPGTSIEIRSLFYTVPARKKFQKTPEGSLAEISKVLAIVALSHPLVSFRYYIDGKVCWSVEAEPEKIFFDQTRNRIEALLGKEFMGALQQCSYSNNGVEIKGWISAPLHHRHNRSGQYIFLNQRMIVSPLVSLAVKEGYSTMIPEKKYPLFLLFIQLSPTAFDVNVHPQKKDVRFHKETFIKHLIQTAVSSTLHRSILSSGPIKPIESGAFLSNLTMYPPMDEILDKEIKTFCHQNSLELENKEITKSVSSKSHFPESSNFEVIGLWGRFAFVKIYQGALKDSFFGEHLKGKLLLVDLKALSRLHFFEKLSRGQFYRDSTWALQDLMIPVTIECSVHEFKFLTQYLSVIERLGIGIRPFGDKVFIIDGLHPQLQIQDAKDLVYQILREAERSQHLEENQFFERMTTTLVKKMKSFKHYYSMDEAKALVERIQDLKKTQHCPKGDPIFIFLTEDEMVEIMKKQLSVNAKQLLNLTSDSFPSL